MQSLLTRAGAVPEAWLGLALYVLSSNALAWPALGAGPHPVDSILSSGSQADTSGEEAETFYLDQVDAGVQTECLICHRSGGSASEAGARLALSQDALRNHEAFSSLLSNTAVTAKWLLAKTRGGEGHGGGAVLAPGGPLYSSLETYLAMLEGDSGTEQGTSPDFWSGTSPESPEATLRRATLLFAGETAKPSAVKRAKAGPQALRREIIAIMQGEGFRQFLMTGANDKLLISGLENGIDFNIQTFDRYPKLAEVLAELPDDRPEEFEDYHERPFFSRGDAEWMFRGAVAREPLELVAHIVMNGLPYTEVLTADYTMVNALTDYAYRSRSGFSHKFTSEDGFYDRRPFGIFRPGYNDGHIPHDHEFEINEDEGVYTFSDYHQWPHAGVLSTQAWLARYPSTDTNRNRARARWTYFHFLGVDIEKSAPRSTDPKALADTDNPTLKNPACTVCHERLDPMAGAYQSFGDMGHYLDQYGGIDSLSDAYKCPECYGGEWGSTGYEEGDTWYRDMRAPGFEGTDAEVVEEDSLQWLGRQMAADTRFPAATVRFWWPTVFGAEALAAPDVALNELSDQHLRAFMAQDHTINKLARDFVGSGFDLKDLLADMVMSRWYRNSRITDPALVQGREAELRTVGRGRLLTPEELDRKNRAIFGRTWRQSGDGTNAHAIGLETALTGQWASYNAFYGGIDGAVVTSRNREITPLMSNVAETMAIDLSCQVVIEDFNRPQGQRLVFGRLTKDAVPGGIAIETHHLKGTVGSMDEHVDHTISLSVQLVKGPTRITINDLTRHSHESTDDEWTGAELLLRRIIFRRQSSQILALQGDELHKNSGFLADRWQDDEGAQHWRGHPDGDGWRLHPGAWVEVEVDLPAGDYELDIELASSLKENNINESMTVKVSARATRNLGQTIHGKQIRQQIATILRRATSRTPSAREVSELLSMLGRSATRAKSETPWFRDRGNNCETWWIWRDEQLEGDEWWHRYGDSEGMMRGWSTVLHRIMTSYGYLHD